MSSNTVRCLLAPRLVALLADSIPVPEQRNQFVRQTGVRRALKDARDQGELLQALAASIDDEAGRARFEAESLNIFQRGTPKAS